MKSFDELQEVVSTLRSENGCPWDQEQTHASLKAACIEEAAEVICGINILEATGRSDNLKEELGDLLLQVLMHAQIAEEEGLFTLDDVVCGIKDKMIRRHPHVFGNAKAENPETEPFIITTNAGETKNIKIVIMWNVLTVTKLMMMNLDSAHIVARKNQKEKYVLDVNMNLMNLIFAQNVEDNSLKSMYMMN